MLQIVPLPQQRQKSGDRTISYSHRRTTDEWRPANHAQRHQGGYNEGLSFVSTFVITVVSTV